MACNPRDKREYQQFLQERNRGKSDSDGRPDRTPEEIRRWAIEHELPEQDGHVQFPDVRIEYEDRDGRLRTLDIEVETLHYQGGHAVSKAASGFSRHSIGTARVIRWPRGWKRRRSPWVHRARTHRQYQPWKGRSRFRPAHY